MPDDFKPKRENSHLPYLAMDFELLKPLPSIEELCKISGSSELKEFFEKLKSDQALKKEGGAIITSTARDESDLQARYLKACEEATFKPSVIPGTFFEPRDGDEPKSAEDILRILKDSKKFLTEIGMSAKFKRLSKRRRKIAEKRLEESPKPKREIIAIAARKFNRYAQIRSYFRQPQFMQEVNVGSGNPMPNGVLNTDLAFEYDHFHKCVSVVAKKE